MKSVVVWLQPQAATYYCVRLGFKEVGYKGLETGSRQIAAHVVQQNKARIFLQCVNPFTDYCYIYVLFRLVFSSPGSEG